MTFWKCSVDNKSKVGVKAARVPADSDKIAWVDDYCGMGHFEDLKTGDYIIVNEGDTFDFSCRSGLYSVRVTFVDRLTGGGHGEPLVRFKKPVITMTLEPKAEIPLDKINKARTSPMEYGYLLI